MLTRPAPSSGLAHTKTTNLFPRYGCPLSTPAFTSLKFVTFRAISATCCAVPSTEVALRHSAAITIITRRTLKRDLIITSAPHLEALELD